MKKIFTPLILLLAFAITGTVAQTLVSTSVLPRNAVLEEFTGVNCVNCPDGHTRANLLYNAYPGRVVIINVHSGSYAVPQPGQLDLRTPFGDSIDAFAGVAAYPSGTMNRIVWPGAYNVPPYFPQNPPNNLAIRRPGWWDNAYPTTGAGANIILQGGNSPVNIGAATTWNDVTRELQVTVELYYTATEAQNNKLNVVMLENGVIGYQSGGGANYTHNHILRNMLTGLWGETITTTTQGTLVTRNYSYIVPPGYVIDNCDISVFVTQNDNKTTHTGVTLLAKNGTTVGLNDNLGAAALAVYPNPADKEIHITGIDKSVTEIKIVNVIGKTVMQVIPTEGLITQNISNLPNGFYFLSVSSGNNTVVKRFVKN
jgi:hypothetical protein